jgi:spermidine/putrescine transport system ATP-binding protein
MNDAAAPAEYALEMVSVTKRFGDVVAVDDATFAIVQGEFFSLLGPSGCGKTTTLRIVAGFEEPTAGELFLNGIEATDIPPFNRDTNLVFQNYALFPHMSVFENVAFGPARAKVPKDEAARRVMETLATVRMDHLADRLPRQLSGGQQQRVGLARALVNRPAILLLDEPLGALDFKLRQDMQIELKRIQREVGISFMYVTHDQEEALTMSDRIAVMLEGRIEQIGTPEEIYLRPTSRFVADFIGKANLINCTIEADGATPSIRLDDDTVFSVSSVAGTGDSGPTIGAAATIVLRPEHLQIALQPPPDSPHIVATVTDLIFQGAAQRYELEMGTGRRITVISPVLSEGYRSAEIGERVYVSWPDASAHLVLDTGSTETERDNEIEAVS